MPSVRYLTNWTPDEIPPLLASPSGDPAPVFIDEVDAGRSYFDLVYALVHLPGLAGAGSGHDAAGPEYDPRGMAVQDESVRPGLSVFEELAFPGRPSVRSPERKAAPLSDYPASAGTREADVYQGQTERNLMSHLHPCLPSVGGVEYQAEVSNRPAGTGVCEVDTA